MIKSLHEQVAELRAVHEVDGLVILLHIQIISRRLHRLDLHGVRLYHLGQEIYVLTENNVQKKR